MDTSRITQIQKAKEYAEQPERVTFNSLDIEFRGDNNTYRLSLGPEGWSCGCPGYNKYGICPHIMAVEKLFKPMIKREPLPYAPGQNIVSDVKKAKRYSEELERIRIVSLDAAFEGKNQTHRISYQEGVWHSTSSAFQAYGVDSHIMAMERLLKGMVEPATTTQASLE